VFTGGGAKGQLWPRIVADVLGTRVTVPVVKESTALGAALYAGIGAGIYRDIHEVTAELCRMERTFDPDPKAHAAYADHFARWRAIYPRQLELSEAGLLRPLWRAAGT
jgi:autoinducer 2 (AI-2) kinase